MQGHKPITGPLRSYRDLVQRALSAYTVQLVALKYCKSTRCIYAYSGVPNWSCPNSKNDTVFSLNRTMQEILLILIATGHAYNTLSETHVSLKNRTSKLLLIKH